MRKITFLILLLYSLKANCQNVPNYLPINGLQAWYPFSGNAYDSSGNGHNGTAYGVIGVADRFGNSNMADSFYQGTRILIPYNSSFSHDSGSLSVWINPNSLPTSSDPQYTIFGQGWGYPDLIFRNDGHLYFTSCNSTSNYPGIRSRNQISLNQWTHVVGTYVNGIFKIYINGDLDSSTILSNPPSYYSYCNSEYFIGGYRHLNSCIPNDSVQFFRGKIDDLGYWNRVLTDCEVYKIYSAQNYPSIGIVLSDTVGNGSNASFSLTDTITNATFQWQQNDGSGFVNISNNGIYSGANTKVLSINPVNITLNNYQFRCIRYNPTFSCGDTSGFGKLIIINPASIQGQSAPCAGITSQYLDSTSNGTWSQSNSAIASISSTGLLTTLSGGVDTIFYTILYHNFPVTTSKIINIKPLPSAGVIWGPSSVCLSGYVVLSNINNDPGFWLSSNNKASVSNGVVTGVAAGVDSIFYIASNICGHDTAKFKITVNPFISNILGVDTVLVGGSITLFDSTVGGVWSSLTGKSLVSNAGLVIGLTGGLDIIRYAVTDVCGIGSVDKLIYVNEGLAVKSVENANQNLKIFPNPIKNTLFLKSENVIGNVRISNTMGQIILTKSINSSSAEIDLTNFSNGLYFLNVNNSDTYKIEKVD
jgi:hypothetical protein